MRCEQCRLMLQWGLGHSNKPNMQWLLCCQSKCLQDMVYMQIGLCWMRKSLQGK